MSDRGGGPAHLDGAFLLQLLRRPQPAAPSPPQQPHSDPAVTAVGNSYAFPPHSFRPPPPPSEPHHFQPPPSFVPPAFAPFVPDFSPRLPDSALGVRAENSPHNFAGLRPPDSALGMRAEDSPHNFPGPRPSSGDSRFPQRDSFRAPGAYDVRRESARVENFPKRDPRVDYGVRRENARVENLPQRDGFRGPRTDYDVRRESARVENLPQRDGFRGPRTDYDVRQENARFENLPQRDGFRGPRTDYDVRQENARFENLPQRDGFRGPGAYDVRRENARVENLPQRDGFRGFGPDYDARHEIARVESFPQNFQGDRRGLGSGERIPHNGAGRWKAVVGNGVGVDGPGEWGKGRGSHPEPMRQEPLPRFRTSEQGRSLGSFHRQNGPPEWVPFKRPDEMRNGEQAEYYRRKENGWSAPSGSERHGGQGSRSEYRPTSQACQPGDAQSKSVGSADDDGRKVATNGSVDDSLSRGEVSEEQDVLAEQLTDALMLKESTGEKKARRYKDLRSDSSRGNNVSSQRTRIHRRETNCRFDIKIFASSFLSIYKSLIPSEEEKEKQKQLLLTLEKLVAKEWPSGQLHIYGSCANSFGFSNSDIDICLAIEGISMSKSEILLKLADILQADNLENVQALTHARVPIVKLMDPVTGISCDICINNLLAVVNTKLLRDYAYIDERLPQLAFIVKHWAKSRGVNETYRGTLSSYAYVLMCIHFLQLRMPAILPCLQEMEATYDATVDDTKCAYFDRVEELKGFGAKNKENIAYLLWAFFQYWAYYYDYTDDVISVRTGRIISKRSKGWTKRILNDRHLICIEDPFEISHDLGRVVDKATIRILREEFERAADVLQYDPNPTVTLFEPYVPPTPRN